MADHDIQSRPANANYDDAQLVGQLTWLLGSVVHTCSPLLLLATSSSYWSSTVLLNVLNVGCTTSTTACLHQRMTIWVNPDSLCKLPIHKPYGVWLLNLCTLL